MRNSSLAAARFAALLSLSAALFGAGSTAQAANKSVTYVSQPQIQVVLEPYTPTGEMRLYPLANGKASYWTTDSQIYKGDKVHVNIFVATGADELQELKVHLDNNLLTDTTSGPWSANFDATVLTPGVHHLEAWALVSGPKPQTVSRILNFFVSDQPGPAVVTFPLSSPSTASAGTPGSTGVLTQTGAYQGQVSGGVQTGNGGQGGSDIITAITVPTPDLLKNATEVQDAGIKIVPRDSTGKINLTVPAKQALTIDQPIVAHVARAVNSGAIRFAYELSRDGSPLTQPTDENLIGQTDIVLRPRTSTMDGLLAGPATLWVWGIDAQGNYSAPQSLNVFVQP